LVNQLLLNNIEPLEPTRTEKLDETCAKIRIKQIKIQLDKNDKIIVT